MKSFVSIGTIKSHKGNTYRKLDGKTAPRSSLGPAGYECFGRTFPTRHSAETFRSFGRIRILPPFTRVRINPDEPPKPAFQPMPLQPVQPYFGRYRTQATRGDAGE